MEALDAAEKYSIEMNGSISKGLSGCDIDNADLIISMEYNHFKKLYEYIQIKKIKSYCYVNYQHDLLICYEIHMILMDLTLKCSTVVIMRLKLH